MTAAVWWAFGTTLGIVSPLLYWRFRSQARPARQRKPSVINEPSYQAIEIRPGLISCEEASALAGQRFLSDDAPELPLPGCDKNNCHCRYAHLDDRRSGEERRLPFDKTIAFDIHAKAEKRSATSDRRRPEGPVQPRSYFNEY